MKLLSLLFLLATSPTLAQTPAFNAKISKLKPTERVAYQGKPIISARWTDKNGSNLLLITLGDHQSKPYPGEPSLQSGEQYLYGYHYLLGSTPRKLWQITDFVKECEVDLTLYYVANSLTITDLDKDGIAETAFLYRLACRGDVIPADQKLLLHEGATKYALRGTTRVLTGQDEAGKPTYYGGSYKVDAAFAQAPASFASYAKAQWARFRDEVFGEGE